MKEIKISSLQDLDLSEIKSSMVTMYDHPSDHPEEVIVRVWEIVGVLPISTNIYVSYQTIQQAEEDIKAAGFIICFPENMEGNESVVASYIK